MAIQQQHYRIIKLFDAYRYRATRAATIGPFYGVGGLKHCRRKYPSLQKALAAVLYRCQKAGWDVLQKPKALSYALNCPPCGMKTDSYFQRARCCERPVICPFCHGRMRVLEPFRKLEWALYGDDAANPDAKVIRPDLQVLAFRTPMAGTIDAGKWTTDLVPRAHCERATELIRERRTREVKLWSAKFGTVWFHVFPVPAENRLAMFRSGVLLVPASITKESLKSSPVTDAHLFPPSKASLCQAFTKTMSFNKQLFRVPPRTLVSLLHRMRNVRLQQSYGRIPKTAVIPDEHDEEDYEATE